MLSASTNVQNYFKKPATQLLPLVSAEWNYNVLYAPFATFSGTGDNKYNNQSSWSSSNSVITSGQNGKASTAINGLNSTKFTINATNIYTRENFEGVAKLPLTQLPSGPNSYKIVFYVRSLDSNIINLSTQVSNDYSQAYGSTFNKVDNFDWQKVELVVGVNPNGSYPSYDHLDLTIDFVNTTLNQTGVWGIEVCNIAVYQITFFDYTYGNLWDTKSPFTYFRPGESYVSPGNTNISFPSRTVSTYNTSWNKTMPVSPATYSPATLFSANSNPLYKNGNISPFSKYKYFVSEKTNGATSIGAVYEQVLDINKIVLKFNVSQSKPTGTLQLSNGSTVLPPINITPNNISDAGICILYYQGNSVWSTNKWAWSESSSAVPTIGSDGKITKSQKISKIVFTQLSATVISGYNSMSYNRSNKDTVLSEFKRLQVIEISPRLELDLSSFVENLDVIKELDNKSTPLPLSSVSANSATINLSNIPIAGPNNAPFSIFSTIANDDKTFVSPLRNMLVRNVKFYINYYIPSDYLKTETNVVNRIIPGGVFYTDTWENVDIKTTKVNLFDIVKFLQTVPVVDYVSKSQSLVNIFTNIMDFSGFTDYNYDELYSVLKDNNQALHVNYFFADSASKTVYDILREAFMAYQIGSYVDEYGVLRFSNLNQIITNNNSLYPIDDSSIIVDTYTESIKTKIGKLVMKYRAPQIKASPTTLSNTSNITSVFNVAPTPVWSQESDDVCPYNYLANDILTLSQNYYLINRQDFNDQFYTMPADHNSYAIIEGEIISTGDKEVVYTNLDNPSTPPYTIAATSANDLTDATSYFYSINKTTNVQQTFTGRFLNVERGLFGTPAKQHLVMKDANGFATKFKFATISGNTLSVKSPCSINLSSGAAQVPFSANAMSVVYPANNFDEGYNTYSVNFKLSDLKSSVTSGLIFNISVDGSNSIYGTYYYVGIAQSQASNKKTDYNLEMYSVTNGITSKILSQNVTNIVTNILKNQPLTPIFKNKQGSFINLKLVYQADSVLVYIQDKRVLSTNPGVGYKGLAGTKFGFFVKGTNTTSSNSELAEIYACESVLDNTFKYHFTSQKFLDALVAGKNIKEKFTMIQTAPQIIGLNMYDVQAQTSPSLGAEFFEIRYDISYNTNITPSSTNSTAHIVTAPGSSLSYSTVINSGYRLKFAVANNTNHSVWTKSNATTKRIVQAGLAVLSRNPIYLSEQQTAERILNPQNVNEVIEVQSDWIQSKKVANNLMGVIARSSDSFSKDISVSLFGDPLIQIGDVITLTHNYKNIKGIKFFVHSVKQTLKDGLTTQIMMNEIAYTGDPVVSLPSNFPKGTASSGYTNVLSASPSHGSTLGGTVITIENGTGFTQQNVTSVTFTDSSGNTANGSYITVLDSTRLTVQSSAHTLGFVDISVVSNGVTYTTAGANAFEYLEESVVLPSVSPQVVADSLNPYTNLRDIDIDWISVSSLENAYKYSFSDGSQGTVKYVDTGIYKLPITGLTDGQTYTYTIQTLELDGSGKVLASSDIVSGSYTVGSGNTPDPNGAPEITAEAIKNASNDVTVKITVTNGTADTYNYKYYDGTSGLPYEVHQSHTNTYTALGAYFPFDNNWFIEVYATNNGTLSNAVVIRYSDIQLGDSFKPPAITKPALPAIQTVNGVSQGNGQSTANVLITQDTSSYPPTSYTFTFLPGRNGSPNETVTVSTLPPVSNGTLTFTFDGFTDGTSYIIKAIATNAAGNSLESQIPFKINSSGHVVSNVNLSDNLTLTWTGDPYFLGYDVVYTPDDGSAPLKPYTVGISTGTTYKRLVNGSYVTISTDGINFTDHIASGKFNPGVTVTATIIPLKAGIAGDSVDSNPVTVPAGGGFTTPIGVYTQVYAQDNHQYIPSGAIKHETGGSFFWTPAASVQPSGSVASWNWRWNFYHGKSSPSGTPTSTGIKSPTGQSIPSNNEFYIETGYTGVNCLEIYMEILGTDGNTYFGPKSYAGNVIFH
jgi:hypothetical protein